MEEEEEEEEEDTNQHKEVACNNLRLSLRVFGFIRELSIAPPNTVATYQLVTV